MSGSASPLWTQAAAEAHVPATQETGRQAAPDRRSEGQSCGQPRGGGSCPREKAAGCCLPVSLLGVCARRPRGQSKGASETDAATGSQEGPLFAAFFGNPFLLCAVLTFSGQDQRGCPPPRPVGDKVSASPGSGRMQRAHASLQASVISPARHGRFCSSAAPKPRNLVRKEMVCLTPASNGRTNPIIFYREIAISLLAAELTQISNAQLGGQAHRLDGPSGTRGSPPVPMRHLHSAARARGPGQPGTQA